MVRSDDKLDVTYSSTDLEFLINGFGCKLLSINDYYVMRGVFSSIDFDRAQQFRLSRFQDIPFAIRSLFGSLPQLGYALSSDGFAIELDLVNGCKEFYCCLCRLDAKTIFNPFLGLYIYLGSASRMITVGRISDVIPQGVVDYIGKIATDLSAETLTELQSHRIYDAMADVFEGKIWKKVSWSDIKLTAHLGKNGTLVIPTLEHFFREPFGQAVFIGYISPRIAYMKTDLQTVLKNLDKLRQIPLDKYIFNPFYGYIIKLGHCGNISVGVAQKKYYRQFADNWWHGFGRVQ